MWCILVVHYNNEGLKFENLTQEQSLLLISCCLVSISMCEREANRSYFKLWLSALILHAMINRLPILVWHKLTEKNIYFVSYTKISVNTQNHMTVRDTDKEIDMFSNQRFIFQVNGWIWLKNHAWNEQIFSLAKPPLSASTRLNFLFIQNLSSCCRLLSDFCYLP